MTALTIQLSDSEAKRLREMARDLGKSPEELAVDAVLEHIERAQATSDFDAVAERVVEKNAELYRRLA